MFLKSTIEAWCATKNNAIMFKTFNNLNIEQLGVCTVKLSHKDKIARCRFFVVSFVMPGDGPTLLGMPDIELLGILKLTCDVM